MNAISRSQLWKKRLGDWVLNPYVGCEHGCHFCYCPSMPGVKFHNGGRAENDWGEYVLPREGIVEALRRQLKSFTPQYAVEHGSKWGEGFVLLSFLTDCYQPKEKELELTRQCLKLLLEAGHKVRLQTRSVLVRRDFDLLSAHRRQVVLGTSIPSLDETSVRVMEPRAAGVEARLRMLESAVVYGIPVYAAIAPVMPWTGRWDIQQIIDCLAPLNPRELFCEVLNPKGSNLDKIIDQLRLKGMGCERQATVRYHNARWARRTYDVLRAGKDMHKEFTPWPDTGRQWRKHLEEAEVRWLESYLPTEADGLPPAP